jgi:hypothetical protein
MPTFMELQQRLKRQNGLHIRLGNEEVLVPDARGTMRPGDFIDEKLRAAEQTVDSVVAGVSPTRRARRI